jgi:ADP-ribose pyrophosphatase
MARADGLEALEWDLRETRPGSAGFLKIETRSYRMPDGQMADWDVIRGGRTVAVVALTKQGQVLLVRQFRPGPERVLLELPGGGVGEGEDVVAAAARELLEETGYSAADVRLVGQTWLAAYSTARRHAVIATGCRPVPEADQTVHKDPLEFIEPVLLSMDEFRAHVCGGQLTDTDIAFMCLHHLHTAGTGSARP